MLNVQFLGVIVLCVVQHSAAYQVVLTSDWHYDALYGSEGAAGGGHCRLTSASTLGSRGCDSPLSLLQSAVDDMRTVVENANFTVFTGDWLRHDMDQQPQLVPSSIAEVGTLLAELSSQPIIAPTVFPDLGNNDYVPDYYFNITDSVTTSTMRDFTDLLANVSVFESVADRESFRRCGFYRHKVRNNLLLIVLNPLVWSTSLLPVESIAGSDPCGQFQFLNQSLSNAAASSVKVILSGHIPPQVDVWNVLGGMTPEEQEGHFWREEFVQRYEAICAAFSNTIVLQLFGHSHKFYFDAATAAPLVVLPALSPIFGNNPSYMIATMDDQTHQVVQLYQRSLDLDTGLWATGPPLIGYLFGSSPLTSASLKMLSCSWASNMQWDRYLAVYGGGGVYHDQFGPIGGCDDRCRQLFLCAANFLGYERVNLCMGATHGEVCDTPATTAPLQSVAPATLPSSPAPPGRQGQVGVAVFLGCFLFASTVSTLIYLYRKRKENQRRIVRSGAQSSYVDDIEGRPVVI